MSLTFLSFVISIWDLLGPGWEWFTSYHLEPLGLVNPNGPPNWLTGWVLGSCIHPLLCVRPSSSPSHPLPRLLLQAAELPKCFLCLGLSFYLPSHTLLSYQVSWNAASNVLCPKLSEPPDCLKLSLSLLCYLSHQTLLPHFWLLTVQKLYTLGKSDSTPGRSSLVCSRAVPPTMLGPLPLLWKPDLLSKASPQASVFSERPCGPGWSNRSLWDPWEPQQYSVLQGFEQVSFPSGIRRQGLRLSF